MARELNFIQLAIEEKLKQHAIDYFYDYTPVDWEQDAREYYEDIIETLDEVWRGEADRHRWYTNYPVVYGVTYNGETRYFSWYVMDVHGDNGDLDDCNYSYPTPEILLKNEVWPKEVKTIIYTKNKEENK